MEAACGQGCPPAATRRSDSASGSLSGDGAARPLKKHARRRVAATLRAARHTAPDGDCALTSGPGAEKKKPTGGSRVIDIPE
jgi:hypothetical protein